MRNFIYTLIILFTFNITQSQEESVGNGATFIAVDYIKTVPGKNYGEMGFSIKFTITFDLIDCLLWWYNYSHMKYSTSRSFAQNFAYRSSSINQRG